MRNYVIINGVSSLTIEGLAINIIPPITKTLMRNEIEEIDGRDGDIITELGYSAYDKEMEIGLWGNYDIDEIIKFFTGEGTVIFSTEPDKYYNFKILNQIDYDKLLKFRTATVTFHCQPFKYPTNEEPIEVEPVVKTGEGETVTIDDTFEGNLEVLLKGNTYQDSTTGKQLFDKTQNYIYTNAAGTWTITQLDTGLRLKTSYVSTGTPFVSYLIKDLTNLVGKTVRFKTNFEVNGNRNARYIFGLCNSDGSNRTQKGSANIANTTLSFTIPELIESQTYLYIGFYSDVITGSTANDYIDYTDIIVTIDNSNMDYEPYTNGPAPNPDFPMPVHVVSGDNDVEVVGKNLLNASPTLKTFPANENSTEILGEINLIAGTKYYVSYNIENATTSNTRNTPYFQIKNTGTRFYESASQNYNLTVGRKVWEFTPQTTNTYQFVYWCHTPNVAVTVDNFMISTSSDTTYEPYKKTTYPINLSEGMFLGSIGDYKDTFFKAVEGNLIYDSLDSATKQTLDSNEWYLEKKIGKKTLNGSETWSSQTASHTYISNFYTSMYGWNAFPRKETMLSNYFKYNPSAGSLNDTIPNIISPNNAGSNLLVDVLQSDFQTEQNFATWLITHNMIVYYPLATPTYTKIEGTLASQLEAVYNAVSYEGQTNIGQTNDDLPFWIEATITYTPPSTIENIGNIYAKPILTITGSGNVGVVLNGIEILQINLGEGNTIAIDVPNLEAYNPNDNTLMNRLVTGDYMKLLIQEGENTLSFNGDVSSYSVTNYTRWI